MQLFQNNTTTRKETKLRVRSTLTIVVFKINRGTPQPQKGMYYCGFLFELYPSAVFVLRNAVCSRAFFLSSHYALKWAVISIFTVSSGKKKIQKSRAFFSCVYVWFMGLCQMSTEKSPKNWKISHLSLGGHIITKPLRLGPLGSHTDKTYTRTLCVGSFTDLWQAVCEQTSKNPHKWL